MKRVGSESPTLLFLGAACAVGVSSIYYNQPLLLEMAGTFHTTPAHVGFVATATQIGYAVGLIFFVSLGDFVERRALMIRMFGGVALSLLFAAVAPTLPLLIMASGVLGIMASVTHIVLPLASDIAPQRERGKAIGTVMTGLLLGILIARTFSGGVSIIYGWRIVFVLAAAINLIFICLLYINLPELPPKQRLNYDKALFSLYSLFRSQPLLRESCIIGALAFASFSCFWTTLVFLLQSRYNLGAGTAGTFGIVGAAGAFVAPFAGRTADRHGSRYTLTVGIATLAASYLIMWVGEAAHMRRFIHLVVLVIGVVVLDLGAQIMQVGNQTRIFGLVPTARSRINTVYMTIYFAGGALGSWLATRVWDRWQWDGVFMLALSFAGLAAMRHATGVKSPVESNERIEDGSFRAV